MHYLFVAPLLLATGPLAEESIRFSAVLKAESLDMGNTYAIEVRYETGPGVDASGSGVPNPILQIDVPRSVRLTGKVLTSHQELAKNEFLHAPYERLLKEETTSVEFELVGAPSEEDAFGLNFIGYVSTTEGRHHFVRRRLNLPLRAGAESGAAPATESDWGVDDVLRVGDRADAFVLPRADGSKASLADAFGKNGVVVTTYRAFW